MLYLDIILVRQMSIIEKCDLNEKPDTDGTLPCLKYGNGTVDRFYSKYFGVIYLLPWSRSIVGPWRPE